jgi:hypothetical protein
MAPHDLIGCRVVRPPGGGQPKGGARATVAFSRCGFLFGWELLGCRPQLAAALGSGQAGRAALMWRVVAVADDLSKVLASSSIAPVTIRCTVCSRPTAANHCSASTHAFSSASASVR